MLLLQYAATSNFGKMKVVFDSRAMPTPSQNCTHNKDDNNF